MPSEADLVEMEVNLRGSGSHSHEQANVMDYLVNPDGTAVSTDAAALVRAMLTINPSRRASVEEAMQHPFWGKFSSQKI